MRRTFKEHIMGYCLCKQIKFIEHDDPWELDINDGHIKITKNKNGEYDLVDRELGIQVTCKASAWDMACDIIGNCIIHEEEESIQ